MKQTREKCASDSTEAWNKEEENQEFSKDKDYWVFEIWTVEGKDTVGKGDTWCFISSWGPENRLPLPKTKQILKYSKEDSSWESKREFLFPKKSKVEDTGHICGQVDTNRGWARPSPPVTGSMGPGEHWSKGQQAYSQRKGERGAGMLTGTQLLFLSPPIS